MTTCRSTAKTHNTPILNTVTGGLTGNTFNASVDPDAMHMVTARVNILLQRDAAPAPKPLK